MFKRELFAVIAGPLVLAGIAWAPSWVFILILDLVVVFAADELLGMARDAGIRCGRILPLLALAIVLSAAAFLGPAATMGACALALLVLPVAQLFDPTSPEGALSGISVGVFAVLYLGMTGACLGWLRTMPVREIDGVKILLFFLVTIWLGDSGAYYIGKNFGRHRMSPRVSPKKTWEGLAGGVAATFAAAAIFNIVISLPFAWTHVMAVAAILAVAAPVGDLVESLFKRSTGFKDSSSLIPGHGGLLDRTDSLLFSAPLVLAYLAIAALSL